MDQIISVLVVKNNRTNLIINMLYLRVKIILINIRNASSFIKISMQDKRGFRRRRKNFWKVNCKNILKQRIINDYEFTALWDSLIHISGESRKECK